MRSRLKTVIIIKTSAFFCFKRTELCCKSSTESPIHEKCIIFIEFLCIFWRVIFFFQFSSREHRNRLLEAFRSTDRQRCSIESGLFIPGFPSHVKVMKKICFFLHFSPFSIIRRHLGSSIFFNFFLGYSPSLYKPHTSDPLVSSSPIGIFQGST